MKRLPYKFDNKISIVKADTNMYLTNLLITDFS